MVVPAYSSRQRGYCAGLDDRWCWSEDETDVVLEIASDVKSAKDVRIKFEPTYLALRSVSATFDPHIQYAPTSRYQRALDTS